MKTDQTRIAIVGLGYVGLPLAVHFADKGFPVHGFDIDANKINALQSGRSYIPDVASERLEAHLQTNRLEVSLPSAAIRKATHIVVTVPTPLNGERVPDLTALKAASEFLAQHLQPGQTVIYESSTFPGTLEEVVLPILSKSGLKPGADFNAGYSPERIDPGNADYPPERIPKVVSGHTERCLTEVKAFYGQLFDTVVPVSSPKVAELCKLFENIQRLVNISLVNEMEQLCEAMGIDFREAVRAAATKPFGFVPYWPGPGIGGHCIPVDPLYFQWKAEQFGLSSSLIAAADEVNRRMPAEIVRRIRKALPPEKAGRSGQASVMLIGVAYKKDVNDTRESTAIDIFRELLQLGIHVEYHDPHIPQLQLAGRMHESVPLDEERLTGSDVVAILTDHSGVDWRMVGRYARAVVDTRGVLPGSVKGGGAK